MVTINIGRKEVVFFSVIILVFAVIGFGVAFTAEGSRFSTGTGDPSVMGHSFGEINLPGCGDGAILKRIGGQWACGTDDNSGGGGGIAIETAYTAGEVSSPIGEAYNVYTLNIQSTPPITTSGDTVTLHFNGFITGPDGSDSEAGEPIDVFHLRLYRDSTQLYSLEIKGSGIKATYGRDLTSIIITDNPPAGTYTYHAKLYKGSGFSGWSSRMYAKDRALMVIAK